MNRKYDISKTFNTIHFKIFFVMICVLIPLTFVLFYNSFYAIDVIHNQVTSSYKDMLSLYIKEIDNRLDILDNYLKKISTSPPVDMHNFLSEDKNLSGLTKIMLSNMIYRDLQTYKISASVFLSDFSMDNFVCVANTANSQHEMNRKVNEILKDSIKDIEIIANREWLIIKHDKSYYLLKIIKTEDYLVGAVVDPSMILIPLNLINLGSKGVSILITSQGETLAASRPSTVDQEILSEGSLLHWRDGKEKFIIIRKKSTKGDFALIVLIPEKEILENLPYLQGIILIITCLSLFLLPMGFILVHKIIVVPLKGMRSVMEKIKAGDFGARIEDLPSSDEFKIVYKTFNTMIDTIHNLRIDVYEEQLNRKKIELDYLQQQMNPHFYMNSLNIIYRLTQFKKNDIVEEMTLCLIRYFRYVFRNNRLFVPLKDELQHVQNYIRIQELRFPSMFYSVIHVEEPLLETFIPPLIIQGFVENTMKYGVNANQPLHLSINIVLTERENESFLEMLIKDNGNGFTEEILEKIRSGTFNELDNGEHTGIKNIIKRLSLLYGNNFSVDFYNAKEGGAIVEILLPIKTIPRIGIAK